MFWNCDSTLSQAGFRLVKRHSGSYLYLGNGTDLFSICKTEKQTYLFSVCITSLEQLCFPSVKRNAKSSGILMFINIVTGVFSTCKTRSSNYLLFSVSQVRHRSVFTLKIIASKNYLVIICNSILEQICKTRSHFLNPFLAIFKPFSRYFLTIFSIICYQLIYW